MVFIIFICIILITTFILVITCTISDSYGTENKKKYDLKLDVMFDSMEEFRNSF